MCTWSNCNVELPISPSPPPTHFKDLQAYFGIPLEPVWGAIYDISFDTISSFVNVVNCAMYDWFN